MDVSVKSFQWLLSGDMLDFSNQTLPLQIRSYASIFEQSPRPHLKIQSTTNT